MIQKNINLLVVDDSSVIRNLISRYAGSMNVNVVATAANGEDALAMYKLYRPNAVSMDLGMSGWGSEDQGGLECIRRIIEFDPEANILVVSAQTDKRQGLKAMSFGASGYLNKPIDADKLFAALNDLVYSDH
ncbi:two-component system chemotaxis response regulator CheY [Neisseria sp. HSC-16F19]|nr:response regulator [Neisseria sp. HSC-16F19]MCP2039528.1 two-component system chemotaxis response regulator CheY [Neisseria sp. HSC-16F19]